MNYKNNFDNINSSCMYSIYRKSIGRIFTSFIKKRYIHGTDKKKDSFIGLQLLSFIEQKTAFSTVLD